MSTTPENRALRLYMDQCRDWVYNLYTNHGVRFNEIYKALVHYREPWVDPSKLRSAITRWKENQQPQAWPSQQPQRDPSFVIPLPPNPSLELWPLLGIAGLNPNADHVSPPTVNQPTLANQVEQHHTEPSMTRPDMPISSYAQSGMYNPYYTPQQRLNQSQSSPSGTSASQPTPQALTETAEVNSMDEVDDKPVLGSFCETCRETPEDNCVCYLFGS